MPRPARGVPFTEAVLKWGDPEALAGLNVRLARSGSSNIGRRRGPDPYWQADRSLIQRLYDRELFASGCASIGSRRHIIDPEELNPSETEYVRKEHRLLTSKSGHRYADVEIFVLQEVPLNILSKPRGFMLLEEHAGRDLTADRPGNGPQVSQKTTDRFRHEPDYRHVVLDGTEFSLTPTQARVVRELHLEISGDASIGWLHLEEIRARAHFASEKLAHLFRRLPNWHELIRSDGRGYYRLNL